MPMFVLKPIRPAVELWRERRFGTKAGWRKADIDIS
jgi:hypothetical protein